MTPDNARSTPTHRGTLVGVFIRFGFRHPRYAIITAFCLAALFVPGLRQLEMRPSLDGLLEADMPMVLQYREFEANFGNTANQLIVVSGDNLFSTENLARLRDFHQSLQEIEGIEEIQSVFNIPVFKRTERGNVIEPLLSRIPGSEEESDTTRQTALTSPILQGNFVNEDATAIQFVISISSSELRTEEADAAVFEIFELVDEAAEKWSPELSVFELGIPTSNVELLELISRDYTLLVPLAFLLVGISIFYFFRSWLAVLLPLITGSLGIIGVLGFMGYADIPINILVSTIILLVLILGCTEDLHLLSEYAESVEAREPDEQVIARLGSSTGKALFLTSLTTVLGFVSITLTPLESLREFAICAATGIAINFVFTILLAPALFRLCPRPKSFRDGSWKRGTKWLRSRLVESKTSNRNTVYAVTTVITIALLIGAFRMQIDTNPYRFFPEASRTLQNKERLLEEFDGEIRYAVVVETNKRDGVLSQEIQPDLREFQLWMENEFPGVLGPVDILEEYFPEDSRRGQDFEHLDPAVLKDILHPTFVDYDGSRATFYLTSDERSSAELKEAETLIVASGKRLVPGSQEITLIGERVLMAKLSDAVCTQLLINLGILAIVVALLIAITLHSWKLGLLSILPNLLPVLATLGVMGWLRFPFNVGTFPVAIIAFSIAVDDTIHLFTRYGSKLETGCKSTELRRSVLAEEIHPVIATSVSICLGYLLLTLSAVRLNLEIGLLFTFAVLVALIADLILTPHLLPTVSPKTRENV